ncbi:MAG: hypothetical protein L3J69_06890 [Desulfobacula sp.]|nr:hypothetical protein [Desulfobacula sp.]
MDAKDFDLTSKMSPALDAHSFLSGIGYDFNDDFTVELGLMWNYYEADKNITANVEYEKSNAAAALGLVYKF